MRFSVPVFPGSNCDHDCEYVLCNVENQNVEMIWHKDTDLKNPDCVVVPGGFSYGDYLRTGAIARFSPVMKTIADFAAKGSPRSHPLVRSVKKAFGLKAVDHSAYDLFMLRFHDYLKENSAFQQNCPKIRLEFQPGWTWICYTDSVAHAVLSGRYALEQTFIIPLPCLVTPDKAPIRVLERLAGKALSRAA